MPVYKSVDLDGHGLISVWQITENQEDLLTNLYQSPFLDAEYNLISHERKRIEYLASRSLLQSICQKYKIQHKGLYKNTHGKPFLRSGMAHISISHSHDMCAAIIHQTHSVGIDIQQIEEKLRWVAHKYLSEKEINLLGDDLELLCIAWCCKEALYKQTGLKGMSLKENFYIHSLPKNGIVFVNFVDDNNFNKTFSVRYDKIENYILSYITK